MIEKQQNYVTGEQKPNMMSSIEAFKFKRRRQICPLLFTGIHRTNFRYITRAVATSEATEVYKLLFFYILCIISALVYTAEFAKYREVGQHAISF